MAQIIPNAFTSYQLSQQEEITGSIFTTNQKQVLQNLLSEAASQKLHLEYDPSDTLTFVQQEAYHTGKIELLQYLLANSDASEDANLHLAIQSPNQDS